MLRIMLGGGLASIHMDDLSTAVTVVLIILATLVIGLLHRVLYKRVSPKHLFWFS